MATKTVGTGGDYSNMAEYAAYWNGLGSISAPEYCNVLAGGEVLDTVAVTLDTLTGMSDTNRLFIRAAAGASFRDNVNVRTNALMYSASNGAALRSSYDGGYALSTPDFTNVEGLQFKGTTGINIPLRTGANCIVRYNIAEANTTLLGVLNAVGDNTVVEKNVLIQKGTAAGLLVNGSFLSITGNTIVALAGGSAGIQMDSALAPDCKNNVVIGFTTDYSMTAGAGSTNNATGNAVFSGTGYDINGQTSVAASEFVSLTPGSEDLRLSASAVKLRDSGATAGTAEDISGFAQPNGIAYDIGAWEYVGAATAPGAPTNVTATAGNASASVGFTAPSSGGSPITGYTVTSSPGGIAATGTSSPINVTGLTNGVAYTFTVHATNSVGNSAESAASNSVTPAVPVPSASVTLVDTAGSPRASLTSLKWAWFDQITPDLFAAPTDKGTAESTDGSGVLTVSLPNTTKTSGQIGWLIVTDSDGTASMVHKCFSGPVAVA